jgi:hypothetical protein
MSKFFQINLSQKNTFSIVVELDDTATVEGLHSPENVAKILGVAQYAHVYDWDAGKETIAIEELNEISELSAKGFGNIVNISKG